MSDPSITQNLSTNNNTDPSAWTFGTTDNGRILVIIGCDSANGNSKWTLTPSGTITLEATVLDDGTSGKAFVDEFWDATSACHFRVWTVKLSGISGTPTVTAAASTVTNPHRTFALVTDPGSLGVWGTGSTPFFQSVHGTAAGGTALSLTFSPTTSPARGSITFMVQGRAGAGTTKFDMNNDGTYGGTGDGSTSAWNANTSALFAGAAVAAAAGARVSTVKSDLATIAKSGIAVTLQISSNTIADPGKADTVGDAYGKFSVTQRPHAYGDTVGDAVGEQGHGSTYARSGKADTVADAYGAGFVHGRDYPFEVPGTAQNTVGNLGTLAPYTVTVTDIGRMVCVTAYHSANVVPNLTVTPTNCTISSVQLDAQGLDTTNNMYVFKWSFLVATVTGTGTIAMAVTGLTTPLRLAAVMADPGFGHVWPSNTARVEDVQVAKAAAGTQAKTFLHGGAGSAYAGKCMISASVMRSVSRTVTLDMNGDGTAETTATAGINGGHAFVAGSIATEADAYFDTAGTGTYVTASPNTDAKMLVTVIYKVAVAADIHTAGGRADTVNDALGHQQITLFAYGGRANAVSDAVAVRNLVGQGDAIDWAFGVQPDRPTGVGQADTVSDAVARYTVRYKGRGKGDTVADAFGKHFQPSGVISAAIIPTQEQILDLPIGTVRADAFVYELLDKDGGYIGNLDVASDTPPTLRFDPSRTVARTLSGVTVYRSDLTAIDVERERVRVRMVLQNGAEFLLGTLMFGTDRRALASWGNTFTPELFDECFLLDQDLEQTITGVAGASVYDLITVLLEPFADIVTVIDAADLSIGSPVTFTVGSSRYAALKTCADLLGCYPPYLDNQRRLRFKVPQPATDPTVQHDYPAGVRIIDETIATASSAYKAPNRFIVAGDDPTSPVVGVYDLPDSAPHSAAARDGRVVSTFRTASGILSVAAAEQAAYIDALTDQTAFGTIAFEATTDPRHDGYDRMLVLGTPYLETAWEITLESGGTHKHEGTTLWPV